MVHPLQTKVRRVGRQARLLLLLRGGALFVTVLVAAALLAGLSDYVLRWQDRGLRTIVSLAAGMVAVLAFCRFLWPILYRRPSDVTLARWMEATHPKWRDQLSSAVAFLQAPAQDAAAGSLVLRQAHIERMSTEVAGLSVRACLRMASPLRPLMWAAISVLIGLTLVIVDPVAAQLATMRLIAPWNDLTWPRRHELTFVRTPERIARGQDFESAVIDRFGNLPPAVTLYVWYDGEPVEQIHEYDMKYAGGRMVHRLGNVTRPLRYRAAGGDDDTMPWMRLEVVAPPELDSLSARITPPEYTNWPAYEASGALQVLAGSRIELVGNLSRPVQQVLLRADSAGVFSTEVDLLGATLDAQRTSFAAPDASGPPWMAGTSGRFWLDIVTAEPLTVSTTPWEIRSVPDQPPTVTLSQLSKGGVVTRHAVVPLQVTAKDDLAVHWIEMRVRFAGETEPLHELRWPGPDQPPPQPASSWPRGEDRTVEGQLDLANLSQLADGKTIEIEITAADYKPQIGRAEPQRLRIITEAELEDRLTQLQSQLIATIDHALQLQREARGQTRDVESQIKETSEFAPRQLDMLKGAELHQRQVADRLMIAPDSATAQIQVMLDEMQLNRLHASDFVTRLQDVQQDLRRIGEDTLPAAQQQLIAGIKQAPESQQSAPADDELKELLAGAATSQDEAVKQLEELAGELAEWEGFRRFAGEFRELLREQIRLIDETGALQPQTLGSAVEDLSPQHRSQLRRMAQRQMDLARRFDGLRSRLAAKSSELETTDPQAAAALNSALQVADRQAVAARMRDSAGSTEQNQLGRALAGQEASRKGLEDILEALSQRSARDTEADRQQLQDAAQRVADLRRRQDEIDRRRAATAGANADSAASRAAEIADAQRALAADADQAAQQIANADRAAAAAVGQSGRAMRQAADQTAQREFEGAARDADEAQRLLADAEAMLAAAARQANQEAYQEERAALEQGLVEIQTQQSAIQQRTQQLAQRWRTPNAWTVQEDQGLRDAADQQATLAQRTVDLRNQLQNWPLFRNQLAQTAQDMNDAAAPMRDGQLSDAALAAQQLALDRLERMLQALKPKPNQVTEQPGPDEGNPPGAPADQPPQGPQLAIEELELIHLMQTGLIEQTQRLDRDRQNASLSDAEIARRQQQLSNEQGRLAQLLMDLMSGPDATPPDGSQEPPPTAPGTEDALRKLDQQINLPDRSTEKSP